MPSVAQWTGLTPRLCTIPVLLSVRLWLPCHPGKDAVLLILENPRSTLDFSSRGPGPCSNQLQLHRSDSSSTLCLSTPFHPTPNHLMSFPRGRPSFLSFSLPAWAPPHPLQCLTSLGHAVFLCDFHHTSLH